MNEPASVESLFPTAYTFTVARLMAQLAVLPDDMPVVMAKDGEGNSFSPLAELDRSYYLADTTWSGDYDEHDGVPVVCLWPVN